MESISLEHLHREPGSGSQTWKLTQIIFFFVKVITVGRKPIQKPTTSCSLQRNSGPPRLFKRSDTHVTYLNRHHRLEGGGGGGWDVRERRSTLGFNFGTVEMFLPPKKSLNGLNL